MKDKRGGLNILNWRCFLVNLLYIPLEKMNINSTCMHTHILLQNNLLEVQVPLSPPPEVNECGSKLANFLKFFLLSSFSLILFASNNGILWV